MPNATHLKLGLFALVGGASAIAAAIALGVGATRGEVVLVHVYFDESVQGLEVGSPVKYRGVPVGTVASIRVAPDRRHVDVAAAIEADHVAGLALGAGEAASPLRAQLGSQGITGVRFVSIDVFDPPPPVPALTFQPDALHIPAAPSLLRSLELGVTAAFDSVPGLSASTLATLEQVELLAAEVREERVAERAVRTLDGIDAAVADVRLLVRHVDQAALPARAGVVLDDVARATSRLDRVLERVEADDGLLASTQRATDALGDLGRSADEGVPEMERALRDVREAAQAVRDLAQSLERDPDMLIQGRARP